MSNRDAQNRVAGAYVDLVAIKAGATRAVHPETTIANAARLSGGLLLRSFDLDLKKFEPGSVVLSEQANEQGPQLINILAAMLQSFGIKLDKAKLGGNALRGEEPKLSVLESLKLLQEGALQIASDNHLNLKEAAQSAAVATAFIVKECAGTISAEVGFNVAVYGFIAGSKTVPPKLQAADLTT